MSFTEERQPASQDCLEEVFRKTWSILSSDYSAQESTFLLPEMVPKADHCIDGNLPVKGGVHSWELRSSVLFLALPHILYDLEMTLIMSSSLTSVCPSKIPFMLYLQSPVSYRAFSFFLPSVSPHDEGTL